MISNYGTTGRNYPGHIFVIILFKFASLFVVYCV
jgi:hypothetical protein